MTRDARSGGSLAGRGRALVLNFSPAQMAAYPSLAAPTQRLTCFKDDSSGPEMLRRVKAWLGDDRLRRRRAGLLEAIEGAVSGTSGVRGGS